jgi:hypothetical protein
MSRGLWAATCDHLADGLPRYRGLRAETCDQPQVYPALGTLLAGNRLAEMRDQRRGYAARTRVTHLTGDMTRPPDLSGPGASSCFRDDQPPVSLSRSA